MPDFLGQSVVPSTGIVEVDITHNLSAIIWEVRQISAVTATSGSASGTIAIFKNGNLIAPTAIQVPLHTGQGITAAGLPYVYIQASDLIQVRGFGMASGDTLTVAAAYREFDADDPKISGIA
jgi:hypothetical protein